MKEGQTGDLIRRIRLEKGLTQNQLAAALHLSDRTISKWERGLGLPDTALLPELSHMLGVPAERILEGTLSPNEPDGGNMKRTRFYRCPLCGNLLTSTGEAEISCCGRKLTALKPQPADSAHRLQTKIIDGEWYLSSGHPMTKEHYLTFAAWVEMERVLMLRLYPEQDGAVRLPQARSGKLYFGCSRDGLFTQELPR